VTWREISCDQYNSLKRATLIDVRSPCEFLAEHIPGSINLPLFTDSERDFIGTIYAREGELIARRRAMDIISPKIPGLIDEIIDARKGNNAPLVIHCWRGGLRSEAVASCLSIVGIDCWRLTGGYKAWRGVVLRDFGEDQYPFRLIALQGHTGVGKTDVLKALERAGAKVIDLEKLANHRGSVFGALGLGAQPSQKDFESMLWLALKQFNNYDGPVFAEAEGNNIGRLSLPRFIVKRLQANPKILVTGSLQARCQRLVADYTGDMSWDKVQGGVSPSGGTGDEASKTLSPELYSEAIAALSAIKDRVSGPIIREVHELMATNQLRPAVELLLVHYYDHYYRKHIDNETFALTISGDDPEQASEQIIRWVEAYSPTHLSTRSGH
jgi:tRNA 2-selenouridine synthase